MTWRRYDQKIWIKNPRQSPTYVIAKQPGQDEYDVLKVWFQGNFLDGTPLRSQSLGTASTKKAAMEIAQSYDDE